MAKPREKRVPGLDAPVLMARIGAPHGVRGQVRVKPFNEDPMALDTFGPLVTSDGRRLTITDLRAQKTVLVVSFAEVTTREDAERLNGVDLHVDRSAIPEPDDEDDFLVTDLVGLDVIDPSGERIGTLAAVFDFGAGDILEIAPDRGRRFMVAFERDTVPEIDIASGQLTLVRPSEVEAEANERTRKRD